VVAKVGKLSVFGKFVGFEFANTSGVDIFKVGRNGNRLASNIWDNTKSSNRSMKQGSVKFSDNIRATKVTGDNDVWAFILRTHFLIEGFLDLRVANENEITTLKIEIANGSGMNLFELASGFAMGTVDS
jgi:hypothetical protein